MNVKKRYVLYFSPTGNCEKTARALCDKSDVLIDFTLPQGRKISLSFDDCTQAVFVMPVYNGDVPDVCKSYISSLNGKGCPAAAVCVYGGVIKGKSLKNAAKLLAKAKFSPQKGAYIAAPHFYSTTKLNSLSPERLERLKEFLQGGFDGNPFAVRSSAIAPSVQPIMKKLTGRCRLDHVRCIACGKCAQVCPVNAIGADFEASAKCILCGACVKVCDQHARRVSFFTFFPPLFVRLGTKPRHDEFYVFSRSDE